MGDLNRTEIDWNASNGIAMREYLTDIGLADYVLFIDRKPVGIIEAKREEEGQRLTAVEKQSSEYANSKLQYLNNGPLLLCMKVQENSYGLLIIETLNLGLYFRSIGRKHSENG